MKTINWRKGSLAVIMMLVGMLAQAQQRVSVNNNERQAVRLHKEVFYAIRMSDNDLRGTTLREVAEFMKTHEDVNVSVVGYADKGTGTAEQNKMYAQRRAQQFKNDLVTVYGADGSRIKVDSKGDTVQPFAENDKNRCVIVDCTGYEPQPKQPVVIQQVVAPTAKDNADEQRRQYQEDRERRYATAQGRVDTVYVTHTDTVFFPAPADELNPESPFGLNKANRWRNWFVQAGVGPGIFQGDHNEDAKYGDRLFTTVNFSMGKWIYPAFGLRAGVDLDMVKMMYNGPKGYHYDGNYEPKSWLNKMAYNAWNFRVDAMFNLSSFMWRPYDKRILNIIPYVGLGYMAVWDEPFEHSLSLNAGLMASVRLAEQLDLNLDLRIKEFDDELNAFKQGRSRDGIASLSLGLTWYFTKRGF